MSKRITIYTSTTCASCAMVKKYLAMKGHGYDEVNIDEQPDRQQDVISLSGQMMVPVTVVEDESGNQQVSVGYNLGQLAGLLA